MEMLTWPNRPLAPDRAATFYCDNCSILARQVHRFRGIIFAAMKKEVTLKQVLAIRCPTCGAAPGEKCELSTGQPRTEPHRDRRLIAKD
jgi:hypothetical protein